MTAQLLGGGPEIGIVVRDPVRTLAFYRDFLGLPIEKQSESRTAHVWWLRCGGGFVKLVHQRVTPDAANPPGGMQAATGLRFLTLVVGNPEELAANAEAAGGRVVREHADAELWMGMLEDPEGNQVEVVRWY